MKVFEKYQKLINACRKYPEVNLSKRCGTKLPPISIEFYRTHKDKERLCWNCSKSK